jgi:hypothetical protein
VDWIGQKNQIDAGEHNDHSALWLSVFLFGT